jgi:hypothetical protein
MSLTRVDFPLPETPVTHVRQPAGIADGDIFQIVLARAETVNQPSPIFRLGAIFARRHPVAWNGNLERFL